MAIMAYDPPGRGGFLPLVAPSFSWLPCQRPDLSLALDFVKKFAFHSIELDIAEHLNRRREIGDFSHGIVAKLAKSF